MDIGANIGYYTLIFARLVGETGRVFAFEPDPANFALLKKNIETNGYHNVVLEQKAVSSTTGSLKLYISEDSAGDHKIYDSGEARQFIEIEAVSLDDYFSHKDGAVDCIKMDIQGAEWAALQGMSTLLSDTINMKLFMEYWPDGLEDFGANFTRPYFNFSKNMVLLQIILMSGKRPLASLLLKKYMIPCPCAVPLMLTSCL